MEVWSERCNVTDLKVEEEGMNQENGWFLEAGKARKGILPLEFPGRGKEYSFVGNLILASKLAA